ncbi:MAG: DUF433 domain-containing protein [Planctomycetota bacterium]
MSKVISVDPDIQGGTPCFAGTRVPAVSLFDYLKGGHSVEYFLQQFPSVSSEQVQTLLEESQEHALSTTVE